ncbi:hypothetical protein Ciccas_007133 [Cichlidogyrus casuarinus]|uniref:Uncharacterized protein n=1 Tax=Cichlidogyrus casuarinus TaxID=1844966 RepID=A0ABD2Q3R3_9PLAT
MVDMKEGMEGGEWSINLGQQSRSNHSNSIRHSVRACSSVSRVQREPMAPFEACRQAGRERALLARWNPSVLLLRGQAAISPASYSGKKRKSSSP